MQTKLFVVPGAKISLGYEGDAGIDLHYYGEKEFLMTPNTVFKIPTGLYMELPKDKCAILFERSGLGSKYGFQLCGRIIDSGYRGQVYVAGTVDQNFDTFDIEKWDRHNICPFFVKPGDKIAQMIILSYSKEIELVSKFEDLTPSERGEKGFGSSDKK